MSQTQELDLDNQQAQAFLREQFDPASTGVEVIGEGAWSRCFGFQRGNEELVVRFGNHVDDFLKDQRAHRYATPDLPIPKVIEIGRAFGGYYAISTRVHGVALEEIDAAQWRRIVPSLVAVLEAMRTADLSATRGFGGWDGEGKALDPSWSSHLLAVGTEKPDQRTRGWRARLASFAEGEATFLWGLELLKQVADDTAPRSLIHADLMNRNVLVDDGRITGVFDWGCARYGDHLYDLAWFEFWAPWHPNLDVAYLRSELERRWDEVGYHPQNQAARLQACYLHIGLDHLAYNAWRGTWSTLLESAARMRALINGEKR